MTDITALIRAWLVADDSLRALVGQRISTVLDSKDLRPALVIGSVSGGPQSTTSRQVDGVETWSVALYIAAGRRAGGIEDLPNSRLAMSVMQTVAATAAAIMDTPFTDETGARIVACQVVSATPGVDPDTNEARATMTLRLTVFA
jgi:hypothetical protein